MLIRISQKAALIWYIMGYHLTVLTSAIIRAVKLWLYPLLTRV